MDFVNPGVLGTASSFRSVFEQPIMRGRQSQAKPEEKIIGEKRSEELIRLTSLFVLRRTAEINEKYLPPKSKINLKFRKLYYNFTSSMSSYLLKYYLHSMFVVFWDGF